MLLGLGPPAEAAAVAGVRLIVVCATSCLGGVKKNSQICFRGWMEKMGDGP